MFDIGTIVTLTAPLGLIPAGSEGIVEHVFPGLANLLTVDLDGFGPTLVHAAMVAPMLFQTPPRLGLHTWDQHYVNAARFEGVKIKVRSNGR